MGCQLFHRTYKVQGDAALEEDGLKAQNWRLTLSQAKKGLNSLADAVGQHASKELIDGIKKRNLKEQCPIIGLAASCYRYKRVARFVGTLSSLSRLQESMLVKLSSLN